MHRSQHTLAALALAALSLACGKDATSPTPQPPAGGGGSVSGTTGAVFSEPGDTTHRTLVGPATIHGDVVLMTVRQGGGGGVDTTQTSPLAGAHLTLSASTVEGGTTTVAQATAGSDGTFSFTAVPAGSYALLAEGPSGSSIYPATAWIATTAADISVSFRLVAKQ
jgi:hypothetical protein